jgi:hypothetical protein
MIHLNEIGDEDWTGSGFLYSIEFLDRLNFCLRTFSEEELHIRCQFFRHAAVLVL